ncbi:metallothiol transferase FosB [Bacillus testis]|uniref:metallothiol transferase FosB n=1 Tax=Bacillus testis TaxID=1622072 RepID=UPI00067F315B|nr:metallothiol transferase FosB [Bacillus testis]
MENKINHITVSVSDLNRSIAFYQDVFGAKLIVHGPRMAYFDLDGLWLALNEENLPDRTFSNTYTHIAFTICEDQLDEFTEKLKRNGAVIEKGRKRHLLEKDSIYFRDPDGHLFEFHTGTLTDRISYYKSQQANMLFFD